MVQVAQMRRTYRNITIQPIFMWLQIFKTGTSDDPAQRMTDKVELELFQLHRVDAIFYLDGKSMSWLLYLLLRPALVDSRKQTDNTRMLILQIITQRFHIKGWSLVSMYKNQQLFFITWLDCKHLIVLFLLHLKKCLMFLEGIDK